MAGLNSLTWRVFYTPKSGHTADEYEDAFAGDPERGRFAIADGASESAFANVWAQIIVNAYIQTPGSWSGWLPEARHQWQMKCQERELSWYAEAKVAEGAYAAFLGLSVTGRHWHATAVGDCCMFQIRDGGLLRAFPMRRSADFDNRPSLLGSQNRRPCQARARRVHIRGVLNPGDTAILMTDALAQWFLMQTEHDRKPWKDLLAVEDDDEFVRIVTSLRQAKELRNDDVTLVVIHTAKS